jgi:hypothetical protein
MMIVPPLPAAFILRIVPGSICIHACISPEYESVGQLAVDFTEKQRLLAERAIEDAMKEVLDAQPASQNGQVKPTKFRTIDIAEFFAICEFFYESTPEIRVSSIKFVFLIAIVILCLYDVERHT